MTSRPGPALRLIAYPSSPVRRDGGIAIPDERDRLIRKLESIGQLSDEETAAIHELPMQLVELGDGTDIVREGDRPSQCCLLLEGLVGRYKLVPSGRRQILSFHTPGDVPDLQSLYLRTLDHSIGTLTQSKVAFIAHDALRSLMERFPHTAALFWRDTLIDAAIFREWMLGLGRRTAHERIAHLLCEMAARLGAVGIGDDRGFPFPVTQAELADALGLTVVHVNRVLRGLREDGIVRIESGAVSILDRDRLHRLADFDPAYLHQDPAPSPN